MSMLPRHVDRSHHPEPYANASELSASVRHDHLLELWPTSRDHDRRHPLLDTTLGGADDRLRAVHDIVSHGWLGLDFDADGEYSANDLADHKAALLDSALLRSSRRDWSSCASS